MFWDIPVFSLLLWGLWDSDMEYNVAINSCVVRFCAARGMMFVPTSMLVNASSVAGHVSVVSVGTTGVTTSRGPTHANDP